MNTSSNTNAEPEVPCIKRGKRFRTPRGALQHQRKCTIAEIRVDLNEDTTVPNPNIPDQNNEVFRESFYWAETKGSEFTQMVEDIYGKIVFWRRNLFNLPSGGAGKDFIRELTRLMNAWTERSPLRAVSMKAILIMPALLLQKPSKNSKAKDHTKSLVRRLDIWKRGDLSELFDEAKVIQSRLPKPLDKRDIETTSKLFKEKMRKGDVNGAIKIVTNNMRGGILPLNDETIQLLREKHPEAREADSTNMLQGPCERINPIIFDEIDEELVLKMALETKGGSGPSGLDSDGWKRILTSRMFGECGKDLRVAVANATKSICTEDVGDESLEAFLACRLVPLDKQPGVRPIGVGEVLRRIVGKTVMAVIKCDIINSSCKVQMCSGQKAGGEAAVHAMRRVFESEEAEAILLVDASNAFNNINRQALLHNVKVVCPAFSRFVSNCYQRPARLFVIGGIELCSKEGTTQGDPIGMAVYATGITPLLEELLSIIAEQDRMAAFADDITASGKCVSLRAWWDNLTTQGPLFGYFPQPKKSWLIVKQQHLDIANECFAGTNIQITTEGERHLGAVIGSADYRKKYCKSLVEKWSEEISLLAQIAVTHPQAAYACYVSGYQHKLTYFIRTIPGFEIYLQPVEDVLRHHFIPAITGGKTINDNERDLLSLPPRLGGLGLKNVCHTAPIEHDNSKSMTIGLQNDILGIFAGEEEQEKTSRQIKNERRQRNKAKLDEARTGMTDTQKRTNEANSMTGASNWLTSLPIKELGYELNKEQFQDALRIRYSWSILRLPTECVCGSRFDLAHALSCKKGGFVTLRHNEIRDLTSVAIAEVCPDVRREPRMVELDGEHLTQRTANRSREARLDISATGFWTPGQRAFFDIRVFDLNARRYRGLEVEKCFRRNEDEKKRQYNERVTAVENGTFTPLVFSTTGGMGRECRTFYKRLCEMLAEKKGETTQQATDFLRTKLSFSLLRSTLLCLRGSRSLKIEQNFNDMYLANSTSRVGGADE